MHVSKEEKCHDTEKEGKANSETRDGFRKRNTQPSEMSGKFILDACCGPKNMWFDKHQPNTLYIDIRKEELGYNKHDKQDSVEPDLVMDFRDLKLPDKSFKLIVCDPPHMKTLGKTSMFRKKYGCLNAETWQVDLKRGFKEMFRVLEDYGILLLKWNDTEINYKKVLELCPYKPLVMNVVSSRPKTDKRTSWFCFMKIPKGDAYE